MHRITFELDDYNWDRFCACMKEDACYKPGELARRAITHYLNNHPKSRRAVLA